MPAQMPASPSNSTTTDPRGAGASGGSAFLALASRMRYIERWALMRSARPENLAEHSLDVAMIAHMLAVLGNVRHGRALDAEKAALIGLYHDASEIITGDMPTPVKYHDAAIRDAYKAVEAGAERQLLNTLPDDVRGEFEGLFFSPGEGEAGGDAAGDAEDAYLRRLVKAADKISALIKCVDERRAGNSEFASAEEGCREAVDALAAELPEVADFVAEFLPSYGATLDDLL